jgi:acyl-CoA synthetase (AMP-forming)/AMP-acid ligase II/3-hydroxymyristoyl/3-hydroxydecanoyl-(acyl carrier protein) dehydratase
MSSFLPLSRLTPGSRDADAAVAFGGDLRGTLTWGGLWRGVRAVAAHVERDPRAQWVLSTESTPRFIMGFLALLQAGREIVLPANMQPGSVAEAAGPAAGTLDDAALFRLAGRFPFAGEAAGGEAAGGPAPRGDTRFTAVDPERASVSFRTSGTTGAPKVVRKRLAQVERELANLHALWGAALEGRTVRSSVSHEHIYGFLFSAMLPLSMGLPIAAERISSPDALDGFRDGGTVLVLSPAFLKRAVAARAAPFAIDPPPVLFSSGGVLPGEVAEAARRVFRAPVREIYGSTETGGIAHRSGGEGEPWVCFPGISVRMDADSRIEVRSPYLPDDGYFATGDLGRPAGPGAFTLLGRADSIVKIEEKRVALGDVEGRIRESPLVEEAHVVALEDSRQFLAAAVVLSPDGRALLDSAGRRDVTSRLRGHLRSWFVPTVIPRKWRYVEAVPRDAQGKVRRDELAALFEGRAPARKPTPASAPSQPSAPLSRRPAAGPVERQGNRVTVTTSFPADCVYFDGHFPSFKLLPAVAQVEWVMHFIRERLGAAARLQEIVRLKFSRPIRPGDPLKVEIQLEPQGRRVEFRFVHRDTGRVYSSGKLRLEASP